METVTRDPWLDMTAVAHGYFHRQDFHLLDKQARLAALSLDGFSVGWMAAMAAFHLRKSSDYSTVHTTNSPSSAFASFRSRLSNPSVNQP
jgi:hypothetical protein